MANIVYRLLQGSTSKLDELNASTVELSLGGVMSRHDSLIIQLINLAYNNIFPNILLNKNDARFGEEYVDYAVIYIHNNTTDKFKLFIQPEVYMEFDTSLAKYEIGLLPKNELAKLLASNRSTPTDVIFKKATSERPMKIIGGDRFSSYLGQDEFCAVYIKRILEKGVVSELAGRIDDSFNIHVRGYE